MTAFVGVVLASFSSPSPVEACGWDYETYQAEAKSMPCVYDALLGFWPAHDPAYHRRRLEAFDYAARWYPDWTPGLDARGISQLKLGELEAATPLMERRLALTPDAYPAHANLGTLLTFSGEFERALEHIDRAMQIEPEAHFGREKYHRALVVFLQRVADDPTVAERENFLGFAPTAAQRTHGSKSTFAELGLEDDAIDALVAMITVYGAEELAEIYFTLGELLAVRGDKRLAYTAYRRARGLEHPRKAEAKRYMDALDAALMNEFYAGDPEQGRAPGGDPFGGPPGTAHLRPSQRYRGIGNKYTHERRRADAMRDAYAAWERERIDEGLAVWSPEGLEPLYARMNEVRRRCRAPRVIDDPRAPIGPPSGPEDEGHEEGGPPDEGPGLPRGAERGEGTP